MLNDWYRCIRLPITIDQFQQLPRNPVYKYEYSGDWGCLQPRPKTYNALLGLKPQIAPPEIHSQHEPVSFRGLRADDWAEFAPLFSGSFNRVQPFASLGDGERLEAARGCLEQT